MSIDYSGRRPTAAERDEIKQRRADAGEILRAAAVVAAVLLVGFAASAAYGQTEAAIVERWAEGETVVVVSNVGGRVTYRLATRAQRSTQDDPKLPKFPTPPAELSGLAEVARAAIASVDHPARADVAVDLAGLYSGVADQLDRGEHVSPQAAADALKSTVAIYLGQVRKTDAYDAALAGVTAELNKKGVATAAEVAAAFREVADGFVAASGNALRFNPARLAAILKLVLAVASKRPDAISAALLELLSTFTR